MRCRTSARSSSAAMTGAILTKFGRAPTTWTTLGMARSCITTSAAGCERHVVARVLDDIAQREVQLLPEVLSHSRAQREVPPPGLGVAPSMDLEGEHLAVNL